MLGDDGLHESIVKSLNLYKLLITTTHEKLKRHHLLANDTCDKQQIGWTDESVLRVGVPTAS